MGCRPGAPVTPGASPNSVVLYDTSRKQWLLFRRPLQIHCTHRLDAVAGLLRTIEQQVAGKRLYAAGFVAYEAGPAFDPALAVRLPGTFPLVWFGIYLDPEPISFPPLPTAPPAIIGWESSVAQPQYQQAFHAIKAAIAAGSTYQVNYSFRLRAPFAADPWDLFVRMVHAQGYGYGAFVDTDDWAICSASPELFFTLAQGVLTSNPMKGTMPRGLTQAEDLENARWLVDSEKNRAENLMIVDMVRNDLGRIAEGGSVSALRLLALEKYPTLWQLTSSVQCRTRVGLLELFCALFPAASITGAPKVQTMRIISALETTPRRIYTGTVGFLAPGGRAQFNVAIRTLLVDKADKTAEYGVGGGIVWDSQLGDEFDECYTKARILTQPAPVFALLETLLWTPEDGFGLLEEHLARLAESAAYFDRRVDIEAIRRQLRQMAADLPVAPHRVRLVLAAEDCKVEAKLLKPLPQPYRIRLARRPIDARDPWLYHKTTHRRIYEQALSEVPGYEDVLLWNGQGELTESCIANVVVEKEGRLLTPPVRSGLLAGTFRAHLLRQGTVVEQVVTVDDLHRCTGVYLVNSVRGMWEVGLAGLQGEAAHGPVG